MNRRNFLKASAFGGAVAMCGANQALGAEACECGAGMPKLVPPAKPAELNLCLQWGGIPGKEVNEKLDYLEQNGFKAVELPSYEDWIKNTADKFAKAMEGRKLFVATLCGPSDLSKADPAARKAEVERLKPYIEKAGELKGVGLIICPARSKPELPFPELREDFVTNTGKELAEYAARHNCTIVLEPLQRGETKFLRQVADGASMARDIGKGASVMGDFWHMSKEETSFMGAFISGGPLLTHVHVASLRSRQVPGMDGDADNYVDGFRGLKLIGYRGAVSFEGGFGKKDKELTDAWRNEKILAMKQLLEEQWAQA